MTLPLGGQVPKDVLQVSNLGTSTQNLNPSKMTNAAKGRMSQSFLGSGAGLPGGVATTATNLFGQFAGKIADDNDATTVENPADVNAQVTSFFGNPGTSILDLIFGALISALGGIPIIGGAIQSLAGWLNGTHDTANEALDTTVSVTTQVTQVTQVLNAPTGVGFWMTGPDPTGIVSVPFSQLAATAVGVTGGSHTHTIASNGAHNHKVSGSTTSTEPAHVHTANSADAGGTLTLGQFAVNCTATYAPWAAIRSPGTAARKILTIIAKKTGVATTFGADVYRMNEDGSVTLVAQTTENYGGDGGPLTTTYAYLQMVLPEAIPVEEGDVIWAQFRMTGAGSVQIMGVNLPMPGHIDGFYPRAIGAGRNPSTTPAPSSIDASAVNGMYQGMTPWVSFGLDVGQTDIPRFIYDDFNRGDFGSQWMLLRSGSVYPRLKDGHAEIQTDFFGTSRRGAAMAIQSMRSDVMSVEADITNTSARDGGIGACLSSSGAGVWLIINDAQARIATGAYNSYTVRATVAEGGTGHWKLALDPDLGVWTATRNGEDVGLSWAESGVPHGNQYRRGGLQVLSTGSSSPRIDNFIVQDIAADDE